MNKHRPLVYVPENAFGANAQELDNDETTPACKVCASDHVGVLNPCYLMLRGSYIFAPDLGAEVFVLSAAVEVLRLPNGTSALIVDINPRSNAAHVIHEECAAIAADKLEATID